MANLGHSGKSETAIVKREQLTNEYSRVEVADGSKFTVHNHVFDENCTSRNFSFSGLKFETTRDREIREATERNESRG